MLPLVAVLVLSGPWFRPPADTTLALRATREADLYARRDRGALWGTPLTTPLLIVDPATRRAASTVPDDAGLMAREGSFYVARIPDEVQLANTSLKWGGRTWAMVLTPLPADSVERGILLMHEVWHAVQGRAGISPGTPDNPHLATESGRTWMRVEARALAAALASSGPARQRAIADALAARLARRAAAAGSDGTERQLELVEGLAEYTGIALVAAPAERAAIGRSRLAQLDQQGSLMRSFPYATGTAWALLLDVIAAGWRRHLTAGSDLALMAAAALKIDTEAASNGEARFAAYGLEKVRGEESARAAARVARQDSLRARYVTGPILRLPLVEMSMSFNPNSVEPLPDVGTVYRPFRLSDKWGVLDADTSGALVDTGFREARVAVPAQDGVSGAGWHVTLNEGWEVVPAERPGDYTIRKR